MAKWAVQMTRIDQYQQCTSAETKFMAIFDGPAAEINARQNFVSEVQKSYATLPELDACFVIWDDEDLTDEGSTFYNLEELDKDYLNEIFDREQLIYRYDDGMFNMTTVILQVVKFEPTSEPGKDEA